MFNPSSDVPEEFSMSLGNLDVILKKFDKLGIVVSTQVNFDCVNQNLDPIVTAAQANCPVGSDGELSGLLRESIGKKVYSPEYGIVIGVVGPRAGFERAANRDLGMGTGNIKIATRYPHWVEFGSVNNAPHPYMRPAWDSDGGEKLVDRYVVSLSAALDKLVPRL